ncbi:hypothetical protein ABZ252_13190 [Streptomyces sp. NPDC006175]|uniref:hypothetical protein n=1 Tax=Streptomyces sp. NPDC006175 TaxID=3154471 RepID=UPI0033B36013
MVQKPQSGAERKERRIDLSLPQVAGSAVAAVAAAVMASQLGVYGTIAGAGVMSVGATCGGSVFQHFFRRTGEQIREVTVQVKHPAGRQVTVRTRETFSGSQRPEDDATRVLRAVEPGADRTTVLRQARPGEAGPGGAHPGSPAPDEAFPDGSYSDARTHGTRVRGWKRSALAATGVFVLSMAGITVYEVVAGQDLGGDGRTTIGTVVSGERHGGSSSPSPSPSDSAGQEDEGDQGDDGNAPGSGSPTSPGTGQDDGGSARPDPSGGDGPATGPAPTPSASGGVTTPEATTPAEPGDTGTTPAAPDPAGTEEAPDQQGGDTAGSGTDR